MALGSTPSKPRLTLLAPSRNEWVLSARAQLDLRVIVSSSGDQFGQAVQRRSRLLLEQAIEDVAANPRRAGVQVAGEHEDVWLYHTRHARSRTPPKQRIARPRHLIVFKVRSEEVTIVRVLHDAMDLPEHLRDI